MGPDIEKLTQFLIAFSFVILIICIISVIDSIASYVLKAIALSSLCDIYNIDNKWIAWIPIFNYYLLLDIGERGAVYVFIPILQAILYVICLFTTSLTIAMITTWLFIGVSIWWMVVKFKAHKVIAKKLDTSSTLLNLGVFFPVFSTVAWSMMISRINKLTREEYFENYM